MNPESPAAGRSWWVFAAVGTAWVLTYFVARGALEVLEFEPELRVAVALLPLLPFAGFLWLVVSGVRSLDELERRVHLEALGIAYPLAVLLLMTLGLVQLAVELPVEDWSYRHVWMFLPVFYLVGLSVSWRRYR